MKPVTFVICAAGRGERFRQHGLNTSKPKLKLRGRTMLERSLAALELTSNDQLVIIGREEDQLDKCFPLLNADWVSLNYETSGQLTTFLAAEKILKHDQIVIFNCDTFFEAPNLRALIDSGNFDGIIPCSAEPGTSWSFCEVDKDQRIHRVTEKVRISEWASVGYYYFRYKEKLLTYAHEEVASFNGKEAFVAPVYNRYLKAGANLRMVVTECFLPFGTIEQVQTYWGVSLEELVAENS